MSAVAVSAPCRSARPENAELSLGMSVGVLCLILLGMFAMISNISVPDIRIAPAEVLAEL